MSSGFFSTRGKALKFPEQQFGVKHTLYISQEVEYDQQRDYDDDNVLLWWDVEKTRPKMQGVISGYVTEGLNGADDDGFRSLYVRGGLQKAIAQACRKARLSEPGFGMILVIEYTHDGEQADKKKKPPKEYHATIESVENAEEDARFFGTASGGAPSGGGGDLQHGNGGAAKRTTRRTASDLVSGAPDY